MKTAVITGSSYKKLLTEILQNLQKTQQKITRQKVEMSWRIGKLVEEHLLQNKDKAYGDNLILRLEQDTKISRTALYKMRNFYQTYPKIPQDDPELNWSHYRVLSAVANNDERKYLEDLTKQNNWSSNFLQEKVAELKGKKLPKKKLKKSVALKKLKAIRGKLFTYQLAKIAGAQRMVVDLGFNIFVAENSANYREGEIVESVKNGEKYSLKKSNLTTKEMHTYKAFLERVVDGDTIKVTLDLGFNIFHKEILRLSKINAPEIESKEGQKSFLALKKLLKDVPFLIIKTTKTDIYGRYIADVFLGKDEEEISGNPAPEEVYLNQALLDLGVVEFAQY